MSSLLFCLGISLAFLLSYAAIWKLIESQYYLFVVIGTYAALGIFTLIQVMRATQMDSWARRLGAISIVPGLILTIFSGLSPKVGCLEPPQCTSGLTPHPIPLALGMAIVTASLFLDVRSRINQIVNG